MAKLCLVGYTYRGYEMSFAFKRAKAFGYKGIEVRDFSDIDLTTPAGVASALEKATRLARVNDLEITSLFYGPLPISRTNEREHEEQTFLEVMATLSRYNIPMLHTRLSFFAENGTTEMTSGSSTASDSNAIQATLNRIIQKAEQYRMQIAIEAHMGTIHDTAASLQRIVTSCGSPRLTASLDFANIVIANRREVLPEIIEAFGPRIGYVHLKNVKLFPWGYDWNLPLRWGDINYYPVLQALKTANYRGPLAVEYCGTGDPDVFAKDDADYLKQLATQVGI